MNMPGFTAEAALYKTGNYYHRATTTNLADVAIHPAASRGRCYSDCLSHCLANCPNWWDPDMGQGGIHYIQTACKYGCGSTCRAVCR